MSPLTQRQRSRVSPGLGRHFISPAKRSHYARKYDKLKTSSFGKALQMRHLKRQLGRLQATTRMPSPGLDAQPQDLPADGQSMLVDCPSEAIDNPDAGKDENNDRSAIPLDDHTEVKKARRQVVPEARKNSLYVRWKALLPFLDAPLLEYMRETNRRAVANGFSNRHICMDVYCRKSFRWIMMLCWDHLESHQVQYCGCTSLPMVLVRSGMFPTAPTDPQMAVSVDLLDFYFELFERSGNAVTALAGALSAFYERRGWSIVTEKGRPISDPFRKTISQAIQWYDMLRVQLEREADSLVREAKLNVAQAHQIGVVREQAKEVEQDSATTDSSESMKDVMQCAFTLQDRCPPCFGGIRFGRPLELGGDVHVCVDACFSHRHLRKAGDCPSAYESLFILPKSKVDAMGERIESLRKKPPSKAYKSKLPDDIIDRCQSSLVAADPKKHKTDNKIFDDTGLAALVCRHEIPLFLANLDTPGEQQKYAVALIEQLFKLLPPNATVVAFYDVGCVLDRSLNSYQFLSPSILSRLSWATAAMHSYTHEWACQVVYGPRFQPGHSLTCGEAVERLWSKLRIVIGVTRTSARSRRLWIVDRRVQRIAAAAREELGVWLNRRVARADKQYYSAVEELKSCKVSEAELEHQWQLQKVEQTSIRNHAPARLKREVDAVVTLQAEVARLETAIRTAQSHLSIANMSAQSLKSMRSMESTRASLGQQIDGLFASLNIGHAYPNLSGVPREFVRLVFLARDIKENIRKRAVAHFLEWDRLDQASGGRGIALGTKLHQETRNKISKRKPALVTAIKKFNGYCTELAKLRPKGSRFHVPQPLSTDLAVLREDPTLTQEVWIAPSFTEAPPRWLEEPEVRRGIYALHRKTRSSEERERCGREADNMCFWYGKELAALDIAIHLPRNESYITILVQRRQAHINRMAKWETSLVSPLRYETHLRASQKQVECMREQGAVEVPLQWLPLQMCEEKMEEDGSDIEQGGLPAYDSDKEDSVLDPEECLIGDLIDDMWDNEHDIGPQRPSRSPSAPLPSHSKSSLPPPIFTAVSPPPDNRCQAVWESPQNMSLDSFQGLLHPIQILPADLEGSRHRPKSGAQRGVHFIRADMDMFLDPTAWLNDICVNDGSLLLYEHFKPDDVALFSSWAFTTAASPNDTSSTKLRKSARKLDCQKRRIWVFPCFHVDHWTLVAIIHSQKLICVYDSLAKMSNWQRNTTVALNFLEALGEEYVSQPLEGWTSIPIWTQPVQHNSDDCGVWLLATVAAICRGYDCTGLTGASMPAFRLFALARVLELPQID